MTPNIPIDPASANFHAGASFPAPSSFLLSSYAQKRHIEYDIWRIHVPVMPSKSPLMPAVLTVFRILSIMRLSPEACRRTLVRSRGLQWFQVPFSVRIFTVRVFEDALCYRCCYRRSHAAQPEWIRLLLQHWWRGNHVRGLGDRGHRASCRGRV